MMSLNVYGIVLVTVFGSAVAGCGGAKSDQWTEQRAQTYPVSGIVTLDDEPVPDAFVTFSPNGQQTPGASGRTDKRGRYELRTWQSGDGAVAGNYRVSVVKSVVEGEDPSYFDENSPNYGKPSPPVKTKHLIPEKYSKPDTSEITVLVDTAGDNDIPIALVE